MSKEQNIKVARPIAPEDVRPGMYVSVLYRIAEVPAMFVCDASVAPDRMLRFQFVPGEAEPLKVVDVCLPWVLVRTAEREHHSLDVRRCRLARLARSYGKSAHRARREEAERAKEA